MNKQEFHIEDSYQYNRSSPARWIWSHIWQHKWFFIIYCVGVIALNAAKVFVPILTGEAFDLVAAGSELVTV